jgi:nitrite reductase (NADH) small subunit
MTIKKWVGVTEAANIPLREGRAVQIGEEEVAIFNLGDRFLAIENRCPHRGGPLSDGIVSGSTVVCPLHAWKVCLESGKVTKPSEERACLVSYRTRLEDGLVLIEIPSEQFGAQEGQFEPAAPRVEISQTEGVFAE